jgi:hypothetical protein
LSVADEAEGVTGRAEPCLHLRTDGNVFHVLAQRVGQEPVQGVPAVPADILAEKSGADSEADLVHGLNASTLHSGGKSNHGLKTPFLPDCPSCLEGHGHARNDTGSQKRMNGERHGENQTR